MIYKRRKPGNRRAVVLIATAAFVGGLTFLPLAGNTDSGSFTDLPDDPVVRAAILQAVESGYFVGYPDRTFRPDKRITAEQLTKVVDRVIDLDFPDGISRADAAAFISAGVAAIPVSSASTTTSTLWRTDEWCINRLKEITWHIHGGNLYIYYPLEWEVQTCVLDTRGREAPVTDILTYSYTIIGSRNDNYSHINNSIYINGYPDYHGLPASSDSRSTQKKWIISDLEAGDVIYLRVFMPPFYAASYGIYDLERTITIIIPEGETDPPPATTLPDTIRVEWDITAGKSLVLKVTHPEYDIGEVTIHFRETSLTIPSGRATILNFSWTGGSPDGCNIPCELVYSPR